MNTFQRLKLLLDDDKKEKIVGDNPNEISFTSLGMDGYEIVEYIMDVEREFNIAFNDIDIHSFNNFQEIVDYIERYYIEVGQV